MNKIDSFTGEYAFLSNFYNRPVLYNDKFYTTSEHAYQAAKTDIPSEMLFVEQQETPGKAKRAGKYVHLRHGWEDIKLQVMYDIVKSKFSRSPILKILLIYTGDVILEEGNTWGDVFWGTCNGVGENHLGKILMRVREELRDEL